MAHSNVPPPQAPCRIKDPLLQTRACTARAVLVPSPHLKHAPLHLSPGGGQLYTFYMYRAISDENYGPVNVNTANLPVTQGPAAVCQSQSQGCQSCHSLARPGVLWYLHHEATQSTRFLVSVPTFMGVLCDVNVRWMLSRQMSSGLHFWSLP